MRLHSLYYDNNFYENEKIVVDDKNEVNHFIKSVRGNIGDLVEVVNGRGLKGVGKVVDCSKRSVVVEIDTLELRDLPNFKLYIAISLLNKSSKLKLLVEKLTEIGVAGIIPFISTQTSFPSKKVESFNSVAISALKQSKGFYLPTIENVISFDKLLKEPSFDNKYVSHFGGTPLSSVVKEGKIVVVIGPEGGFTKEEVYRFKESGFGFISLGLNVLRAETAAIAVASRILIN
ncbi:MAG: hypothetical protein CR982_08995 [Candidatus Cloacimonadota bacterium]|nr:MAG: hypothetical protein CR982_08995 [Candidatus Cloacimonadota bacterium]PIE78602.1 MAG: hypothetical protein CSA15_06890 [Candidatus Delongbacteria bacterium]